jgi:hypothetical protein
MQDEVLYRERVTPRGSSYVPLLLLPPAGWLTTAQFAPLLGVSVGSLIALITALLMFYSSALIVISKKHLQVGAAKIPISKLGNVLQIRKAEGFKERGPLLDARAYVKFQTSIPDMVKIEIKDADDPTPYWLFSSRNPETILGLLRGKG